MRPAKEGDSVWWRDETGKVIFVKDDQVTVLFDGYECSNSFKRSEIYIVEKSE